MLNDELPLELLALVLVAKLVSTAAIRGLRGANGGILTPTLFMGAAFGAVFGNGLHLIDPHLTSQPAAYAVVGMGGVSGGHDACAADLDPADLRDDARLRSGAAADAGLRDRALRGAHLPRAANRSIRVR